MKYDPTLCVVLSIARVTFDKDIAAVKSLGMKYLFCLYHLVLKLLKGRDNIEYRALNSSCKSQLHRLFSTQKERLMHKNIFITYLYNDTSIYYHLQYDEVMLLRVGRLQGVKPYNGHPLHRQILPS